MGNRRLKVRRDNSPPPTTPPQECLFQVSVKSKGGNVLPPGQQTTFLGPCGRWREEVLTSPALAHSLARSQKSSSGPVAASAGVKAKATVGWAGLLKNMTGRVSMEDRFLHPASKMVKGEGAQRCGPAAVPAPPPGHKSGMKPPPERQL